MSDWVTVSSSLATAAGTLVLAVATFSSVRSANRSARVAERSLLAGLRPVLIPSKDDDPAEQVRFGDGVVLSVTGHGAAVQLVGENVYLGMALRNGGNGLAVIHGWHVQVALPTLVVAVQHIDRQPRTILDRALWRHGGGEQRRPPRGGHQVPERGQQRPAVSGINGLTRLPGGTA